ncbi:MAG: 1-acyl-sn-glycerol-3-phosphate acyltransferase [Candidatus Komeilibacteria bacterium]|nr:1-acyl-sn-glycerol-3-phosphate acyltransferase [Candidatus Komeilibacteria bacterium]
MKGVILDRPIEQLNKPRGVEPAGLISEFNALGNHPEDIYGCVDQSIKSLLARLGVPEKYAEVRCILFNAIKDLEKRPKEFSGHYIPSPETRLVLKFLVDFFVNLEKCRFFGKENFDQAIDLIKGKNNVLIVQNHTSPMDTLVPLALLQENYGDLPLSIIMSQVFEYARVTNLITSGVEKFPVFQPKHMARFKDKPGVINEMCRQNAMALKALLTHSKEGGKMIFLYPEKDRNSNGMGVPEPAAMGIPEVVSRARHDLYILPTCIGGVNSIFPNSPGRNELDDFFQIISRGQGDFYCGEPIKYSDLIEQIGLIPEEDQTQLLRKVLGSIPEDPKLKAKVIISIVINGLIAQLVVEPKMRGIYDDALINSLVKGIVSKIRAKT